MPYLSRMEIEQIATRVVNAYWKVTTQDDCVGRKICPEILAERALGLTVEYHSLSQDGSILGMTAFECIGVCVYDNDIPCHYFLDGRTLLIDSSLAREESNFGRRNFTVMHETCHQIYRMIFPAAYMLPQYRKIYCYTSDMCKHQISKPIDWEEWRVNTLTAAILMPKDLLMEQMQMAGLGEKIRLLNRVFAPREYKAFTSVAEALGVSKSALAIRMKQLCLLERDDLKDPYALVRVECDQE